MTPFVVIAVMAAIAAAPSIAIARRTRQIKQWRRDLGAHYRDGAAHPGPMPEPNGWGIE